MIALYLRKEPTSDWTTRECAPELVGKSYTYDVAVYYDEAATRPKCRFTWMQSARPDRRNKYTTINCNTYRAYWLPDAHRQTEEGMEAGK